MRLRTENEARFLVSTPLPPQVSPPPQPLLPEKKSC
jgi:hypothetical protein